MGKLIVTGTYRAEQVLESFSQRHPSHNPWRCYLMEDCVLQCDISNILGIYSPVSYGLTAIYLSWSRLESGLQLGRFGPFSLTQLLLQKST